MKKIILGLVVTMMIIVANAASVTWQVTNINLNNSGDSIGSYMTYLVNASVTSYDSMSTALANGDLTSLGAYLAASNVEASKAPSYSSMQKMNRVTMSGVTGPSGAGYTTGQTYNFYTLLIDASAIGDASNYILMSADAVTMGGASSTVAFDVSSATWQKIGNSGGGGTDPIPEPTSGLLLLVGGALLALRRKQK